MREPKKLYNLRYYARRLGYSFIKKQHIAIVPEGRLSSKVEKRLNSFGYGIQLNLFGNEN